MKLSFFLGLTQDFIAKKKKEHSNCPGEFCICLFFCCFVFPFLWKNVNLIGKALFQWKAIFLINAYWLTKGIKISYFNYFPFAIHLAFTHYLHARFGQCLKLRSVYATKPWKSRFSNLVFLSGVFSVKNLIEMWWGILSLVNIIYSRLPITRTFKGNREKFELSSYWSK